MKNDPKKLEAEAQAMLDKLEEHLTDTPEPKAADKATVKETVQETQEPEDTSDPAPAPDTPEVDESDTADPEPTDNSGELSDAEIAIEKANQRYKNAQAKMTKASQEAANLRRVNEQMQRELETLKNQAQAPARDTAKIDQIKEDYPDLAVPLLNELERTQAEVQQAKELLAKQQEAQLLQEQQASRDAHFERIKQAHPDVDTVIESDEWLDWLELQDTQVKYWVENGSSNDAVAVLNKFKADVAPTQTSKSPREQVLEKAKAVAEPRLPKARKPEGSAKKRTWTLNDVKSLSNEEFEKYENEIFKAMAEGSIARS